MHAPPHRATQITALCTVVLAPFLLLVTAQQDFQSCIAAADPSSTTVVLHTPTTSPDFTFLATRGIYTSPTPAFIASVYSTQDVVVVVRCAAAQRLQICPRSGGHSFTGQSTCPGVLIDVRNLNTITYDQTSQQITLALGNNLGELLYAVLTASAGSRIVGVGLCPSVGTAGYLTGGGHNPYAGIVGITCESLANIQIVTGAGNVVTASPTSNPDLFWASCGGGGGHFGVATFATLNTHDAALFNNNVYFRFTWPRTVAGSLLSQWMDYDQDAGQTWFRLELRAGEPVVYGYGVCWGASTTDACFARLSAAPFFSVPGRATQLLVKGNRVAQFQAFIGPYGNWGNNTAPVSDQTALLNNSYLEAGIGVHRVYSSGFFKFPPGGKPSATTLQAVSDTCFNVDRTVVNYLMCIFNPWDGAEKSSSVPSAFAHHDMNAFTEFVGDFGSPDNTAGRTALENASGAFRQLLRPYFAGLYVNYPEYGLSDKDYGYLYWGQGYQRLANIRAAYDPGNVMAQVQGLPSGTIPCQYSLNATSSTASTRSLQIVGYDMGQLIGMQVSWTMSPGCSIDPTATVGASVNAANGIWTAQVYSNAPFTISVTAGAGTAGPAACKLTTVDINGISCTGSV